MFVLHYDDENLGIKIFLKCHEYNGTMRYGQSLFVPILWVLVFLFCPPLYWFGLFFSSEVEFHPYTPASCSVMTFWAEYKVEVAVVLGALPVSARVPPTTLFDEHDPHLLRSSFRLATIDDCSQQASCVSCGQAYWWKAVLTMCWSMFCLL